MIESRRPKKFIRWEKYAHVVDVRKKGDNILCRNSVNLNVQTRSQKTTLYDVTYVDYIIYMS